MIYKKALYFIGECLTLTQYPERKNNLLEQIQSGVVNWETIVRVSTGHMVLPALFLNLKRADLTGCLPLDLVAYCEEITQQNRDRNTAIIKQAKQLNSLLKQHSITPVFLKGTAHLLENLYSDMGERMVGDIDFLVAENQVESVAEILSEVDYKPLVKFCEADEKLSKHYPRLVHDKWMAAVEIHRRIIQPRHKNNLGYNAIFKDKLQMDGFFVPSYPHQAAHNILNVQINDSGFLYAKIMMRQMYDGYLLSFKPHVVASYKERDDYFYRKNGYLKLIQLIFKTNHLHLKESRRLRLLMLWYFKSINFPKTTYGINFVIYFILRLLNYPKQLFLACFKKELRISIYRRLRNPSWYAKHLKSFKYEG
ncbi:MAG: nucleotidyltransferase family protein [Flavobacteriaceae bacterium]|nr:nucleotidyltransferase family protein [Flavobacteriaceae bacterium]